MINRIHLNNFQKNLEFNGKHKFPISLSFQSDKFIRSKNMAQYDTDKDNAVEFLSGVGIEKLASDLIENDNWNNGSDIVGFNKREGKVVDVVLDIYNFKDGENKEFSISNQEFLNILEQVKNKCIKQNPAKKDLYESLCIKLSKKLK